MATSAICATCNILSVVNSAAILGLYVNTNKRLSTLEGTNPVKILASSKTKDPVDVRISTLENEITVLLQRLQVYDELFLKMMNRIKEINPVVDRLIEDSPASQTQSTAPNIQAKKTTIRRRSGSSLLARKEPFVDDDTPTRNIRRINSTSVDNNNSSEFDDADEESFSFLK